MAGKNKIIFTLKEITTLLRERQLNEFDCNLGVSGKRGDGKSTLLFKLFNSFKKEGFIQKKHQVYAQDDVIRLLATERFGFCWDDEAINSGYKRDFQKSGQKTLIKVVTNYRDNYNIYASALPFFYSLDKDLRELIFMHIHIIERGLAVIFIPLDGQIHSQDPWDTKNNMKVEQKENDRRKKNPKLPFRYHRFTTFAGYIYFGAMTDKQKAVYLKIKHEKRSKTFNIEDKPDEVPFIHKVYQLLIDDKLTKDGLMQVCLSGDKKYSNVLSQLNGILKDNGEPRTVKDFFRKKEIKANNSKSTASIDGLVPSIGA